MRWGKVPFDVFLLKTDPRDIPTYVGLPLFFVRCS